MSEPKKLPVVTSAATTAFCGARVDGPGGLHLWIDGNDKITAGNGAYGAPKPNALSLEAQAVADREAGDPFYTDDPPGEHCPGSTSTCRASCYVHGLEKHARDTYELYRHNSKTIREIVDIWRTDGLEHEWAATLGAWIAEHCTGGFRWHVSGDVFAPEYATFIREVCDASPGVRHWIYTRSFWLSAAFVGCDNLTVNYSVDRDNYEDARKYVEAHEACGSPVRLCYLTSDGEVPDDLPEGSVIFPDYSLRGERGATPERQRATSAWYQGLPARQRKMVCGVDFYGKSEGMRCGPCSKCIDPP